jgi:hypothetical protein
MDDFCTDNGYLNNGNNAGAYLQNCASFTNYSIGIYQQTNSLYYLCQKCEFLFKKYLP